MNELARREPTQDARKMFVRQIQSRRNNAFAFGQHDVAHPVHRAFRLFAQQIVNQALCAGQQCIALNILGTLVEAPAQIFDNTAGKIGVRRQFGHNDLSWDT
jgi:hypothetical protein